MQKDVKTKGTLLFSPDFIMKFKNVLSKIYQYQSYMDFIIVPTLSGKKTLSYLPLVSYTDRYSDNVQDLLELAKDNAYQIRVINHTYTDFQKNDTVTMRLDINNISSQDIFMNAITPRCRNKIRNAQKKYNYFLTYGNASKDIEDFYTIFSATMHKHGTPVLDKKLFYTLAEVFQEDIIFFNAYEKDEVVATMCILMDKEIVWYPWGGIRGEFAKKLAGYYIYWEVLEHIIKRGDKKVFDFGRSAYGGTTYQFKAQFGAKPLKIDILSSNEDDIYTKYALASLLWKKIPKGVVDFIGPKLCKYLVDL